MMRRRTLLGLALVCLFAGESSAQLLLYDPFDYPADSSLSGQTNPSNGQTWMLVTGTSGTNLADPKIGGGNLTGPAGLPAPAGNSVLTDRTQVGASRVALTAGLAPNSGTVYYSALVRVNDLAGLTNTTTGSFFAGLNAATGTGTGITNAGAPLMIHLDSDNSSAYNLGIGATTANGDRVFDITELTAGQTVFVVGSYEFIAGVDNDVARLWINPDPLLFALNTPPAPTVVSDAAVQTGVSTDNGQLASFFLRNNSVEPAQIQVDEVRVGTSPASVIPEPGAGSVAAVGGLALLARRRRRRSRCR